MVALVKKNIEGKMVWQFNGEQFHSLKVFLIFGNDNGYVAVLIMVFILYASCTHESTLFELTFDNF